MYKSSSPQKVCIPCAVPNCAGEGLYPAPHSPMQAQPYRHLCLEHIRAHNAKWDSLAGLSEQEIEKTIRHATVWERPSWPLGKGPLARKATPPSARPTLPPKIVKALALLELHPSVTFAAIKARYRRLIKQTHPDANGGSRAKIEHFYALQEAFATLRAFYARKQTHNTKKDSDT